MMVKYFQTVLLICLLPLFTQAQPVCSEVARSLADLRISHLREELDRELTPFFASKSMIFDLETPYFSASLSKNYVFVPPHLVKKIPVILIGRIDSKRPGSGLYSNFLNLLQAISAKAGYQGLLIYIVSDPRHHQFYLRNGFVEHGTPSVGSKLKSKDFLRLNSATAEHPR